jgi:hypothetical protein
MEEAPLTSKRRSLTPPALGPHEAGVHATRRSGARHEVSMRVTLTPLGGGLGNGGPQLEGWALNMSRGGVRVILEERVELGAEFDVELTASIGETALEPGVPGRQPGRIVWVQEEPDGVVAGIAFRNAFVSTHG